MKRVFIALCSWGAVAWGSYWILGGVVRTSKQLQACGRTIDGEVQEILPDDHNSVVVAYPIHGGTIVKKFARTYSPNKPTKGLRPGDMIVIWSCPDDPSLTLLGDPQVAERSERSAAVIASLLVSLGVVVGVWMTWIRFQKKFAQTG